MYNITPKDENIWRSHLGDPDIKRTITETAIILSRYSETAVNKLDEKSRAYDSLGKTVQKYLVKFFQRHNSVKIIGMAKPIPVNTIYLMANIMDETASWQSIKGDRKDNFSKRYSHRKIKEKLIESLHLPSRSQYIMILGSPGGGKTTFLKQIGIRAVKGKFTGKPIPVFISLKELSYKKETLMEFIASEFGAGKDSTLIKQLLEDGGIILLLDGLNEVGRGNLTEIIDDIKRFCETYSRNRIVISCRTADYNYNFPGYLNAELLDYTEMQTELFVKNRFVQKKQASFHRFWEMITSEDNKPLFKLAGNPLLLSLLCYLFDQNLDLPTNRSKLYEKFLNALIRKWDVSLNASNKGSSRYFPDNRKKKLLGSIAAETFVQEKSFFQRIQLEQRMADLPEDLTRKQSKAIETKTDILDEQTDDLYSFSHPTFHEFFAASYLVHNRFIRNLRT